MIQYEHHNELAASDAVELIKTASNYLHAHAFCNAEAILWRENDEVICAKESDDNVVGAMTFFDSPSTMEIFIVISYVIPARRMEGIHTGMYAKLKEIVRERGRKYTCSVVHVDNKGMHEHLLSQGRKKVAVVYQEEVGGNAIRPLNSK